MKTFRKLPPVAILILIFNGISLGQPAIFYDFPSQDFENSVQDMVAMGDSLYILIQDGVAQDGGTLASIGKDGGELKVLKTFSDPVTFPSSLEGDDGILYGTTRFSQNNGGTLFKYTIATGEFDILKDFDTDEAQEISIIHVTDSVLWCLSGQSELDKGSVFLIDRDGTNFRKIYNNTNLELGQNPVDIEIVDDQIYITCFNGGGIPYGEGDNRTSSGSIIRINTDGSGYTNIFQGQDLIGTQPASMLRVEDKIYVYFTGRGTAIGSTLYRFDTDGTNFELLAEIRRGGRGELLLVEDRIFGISFTEFFEYDLTNETFSILFEFSDIGTSDVTSGPVFFNNDFFATTQQGNGGAIVNYNTTPQLLTRQQDSLVNEGFGEVKISFEDAFFDFDGDQITLDVASSDDLVATASASGLELTITEAASAGSTFITVNFFDSGDSPVSVVFRFEVNATPIVISNDTLRITAGATIPVNLNTIITDVDEEGELLFEASTADESIIGLSVDNNILFIEGLVADTAVMQIKATDSRQASAAAILAVIVEEKVVSAGTDLSFTPKFYPVPATDQIVVESEGLTGTPVKIRILDIKGVEQLVETIQPAGSSASLNIANLRPGTYLILISSQKGQFTGRFSKK